MISRRKFFAGVAAAALVAGRCFGVPEPTDVPDHPEDIFDDFGMHEMPTKMLYVVMHPETFIAMGGSPIVAYGLDGDLHE